MTDRYAPWVLTGSVIAYPVTDGFHYDIDLGQIHRPAQALDWLFHVSEKNWGRDALPGLVAALRDRHDLRTLAARS